MTTRWFVEVSPVDADTLKERYCVEAVQWQQALQATRKLRGDSGPLSRFSIELLDNGYRALDPSAKMLYAVAKAPDDAPLTANMPPASMPPASMPPASMPPASVRPASVPPPSSASPPSSRGSNPDSKRVVIPRPSSSRPPPPRSSTPPAGSLAVTPNPTPPQNRQGPQSKGCVLLSKREEDPTEAVPITYREYSYVVAARRSERDLRDTLNDLLRQIQQAIERRAAGKYVQIALFDGAVSGKPTKPPVAVLAWKDWRGDPVIQIDLPEPPLADSPPQVAEPHTPETAEATRTAPPAAEPERPVAQQRTSEPAPRPSTQAASQPEQAASQPEQAASQPEQAAASEPAPEVVKQTPSQAPTAPRARRGPEDELISDLFERMHDLRFITDVISGAQYVLETLWWFLPCEAAVIHVHDINTAEFVVVRATGPGSDNTLLHRTSDKERLFRDALRRGRALRIDDGSTETHYSKGLWAALDLRVARALCGPVQQGGRYLGMIELANPITDAPFYDSEINALDYICEQFAEFTANRPIVLTRQVVLRGL